MTKITHKESFDVFYSLQLLKDWLIIILFCISLILVIHLFEKAVLIDWKWLQFVDVNSDPRIVGDKLNVPRNGAKYPCSEYDFNSGARRLKIPTPLLRCCERRAHLIVEPDSELLRGGIFFSSLSRRAIITNALQWWD